MLLCNVASISVAQAQGWENAVLPPWRKSKHADRVPGSSGPPKLPNGDLLLWAKGVVDANIPPEATEMPINLVPWEPKLLKFLTLNAKTTHLLVLQKELHDTEFCVPIQGVYKPMLPESATERYQLVVD